MKHNLLKTLLVSALALGAWGGVSADTGDVKTNIDIDFSNAIADNAVKGTTGSINISSDENFPTVITDGILELGKGTHFVEIPEGERAGAKDVVTTSFDLGFAKLSNRYVGFYFEDKDGSKIGEFSFCPYSSNIQTNDFGIETSDFYYGYNTVIWARRASFTITYDYANKTISTSVLNNWGGKTTTHTVKMSNESPIAKFCVTSNYDNTARRCQFDNLKITTTEGDYTVEAASYTIKRVCGDVTLSEETSEGEVGATPSFTTDAILKDGHKYIYASNDAETIGSIAKDGTTVYTLNYTEVNKVESVKVNYICGDETVAEDYVTLDGCFEGDVVNVPFRYYLRGNDDNLYYSTRNTTGDYFRNSITLSASDNIVNKTVEKAYDSSDVVLFEDLDGATSNNADTRASYGSAYDNKSYTSTIRIAPGKYTVFVRAYNKGRGSSLTIGDKEIFNSSVLAKMWVDNKMENVEISKRGVVAWNPGSQKTTDPIDIILIVKTGEATTETATITDAGFATYVPSNNVVVPSEKVTVYTAKVAADNKVNLTAVEAGTVLEAGKGYVIAGEAGDYNFTVTEDAAKTLDNDLKAATADVTADGTQYVLAKQDTNVGFSKVEENTTIAAGKAYLVVNSADQTSAKAFLAIGGGTTGVEAIEAATADNDVYYSISGVKTTKPAKGLYIHNGKKVIVK